MTKAFEIPVRRGAVAVEVAGPLPADAAIAVLLVQDGSGSSAESLAGCWTAFGSRLPEGVCAILVDRLGCAASDTDDLVAVLEAFGASNAVAVGHAGGALAVALLAGRSPGPICSVLLVDPVPIDPALGSAIECLGQPVELLRSDGGGHGAVVPLSEALSLADRNPNVSLVTVPGLDQRSLVGSPAGGDVLLAAINRVIRRRATTSRPA